MANVQKFFGEFDNKIRLGRFDENADLREKRDIILKKLKDRLKEIFQDKGKSAPIFTHFDQGSYGMGTGVVPMDGDYDIDVGLLFEICKDDHPDPVVVKKWVYDALNGHTQQVEMKRPCVTVQYQMEDEPIYHVDLTVYSDGAHNSDGRTYLAKGKLGSDAEHKVWEVADPKALIELITNRFTGDKGKQYRRAIRCLKRWKDVNFSQDGNAAPLGIGITVAAYSWFQPSSVVVDPFQGKYGDDDLGALKQFVGQLLNQFTQVYQDGEWVERLIVKLPVEPRSDLFGKMTNLQMSNFKQELEELSEALQEASNEVDPVEACKILNGVLGEDFPVPPKSETAQKRAPAIVSSSESA